MLEGVHRGDPRENLSDDALEMIVAGAFRFGSRVKFLDEFDPEQLHAH